MRLNWPAGRTRNGRKRTICGNRTSGRLPGIDIRRPHPPAANAGAVLALIDAEPEAAPPSRAPGNRPGHRLASRPQAHRPVRQSPAPTSISPRVTPTHCTSGPRPRRTYFFYQDTAQPAKPRTQPCGTTVCPTASPCSRSTCPGSGPCGPEQRPKGAYLSLPNDLPDEEKPGWLRRAHDHVTRLLPKAKRPR